MFAYTVMICLGYVLLFLLGVIIVLIGQMERITLAAIRKIKR